MPNEVESTTSSDNSKPPESLEHSATRKWAGLRFLYDMVMQEDARAALADNRKLANRWNNMNLGGDGASAMPAGEDMGDMIAGDQKIINHHYHQQAAAKSKLGTLAKLAIGAGLIATGAGVTAGVPFILSAWKDWKQPAAVQHATDVDTDTTGEIMLWPPKAK